MPEEVVIDAALNVPAVTAWMRACGCTVTGSLRVGRVGLGQSNLTYMAKDDAQHRWILRRPPLGHLLASAHNVTREARILRALERTDVPVPRILGVAQDPAVCEAPLVLMEFVDGLAIDRMSMAEALTAERRRAIGMSMPAVLARIHDVDLKAIGLDDLASHKPYAARQLKRWAGQWALSKTRESPQLDALTQRLLKGMPPQSEVTLVHGDFHWRNILVDRHEATAAPRQHCGEIVAALDWELSTLGDPLADVGSMLAYWVEADDPGGGGGGFRATTLAGVPPRRVVANEYLKLTGRDGTALQYWRVLGLWKLAIIGEGVMRRALDEPRNKAAAGTPTVDTINREIVMATRLADQVGL